MAKKFMKFINVLLIHKLRYWNLYNFRPTIYCYIWYWMGTRNVTCNLLPCHLRQQNEQRKDAQKVSLSQIMRMTIMNALHRSIVFNKINKSINLLTWIEKERERKARKILLRKMLTFRLNSIYCRWPSVIFTEEKSR